jgi:hypothetical protein
MRSSPASQINPKKRAWQLRELQRAELEQRIEEARERQHGSRPGSPSYTEATDELLACIDALRRIEATEVAVGVLSRRNRRVTAIGR